MGRKTIICKEYHMVVNQVLGRERPENGPRIAAILCRGEKLLERCSGDGPQATSG